MAILLMILGALSVCAGVAAIAYGVPIKEFSLGNTLILSGTTALVGGVLIAGVGIALRQLREIADGLASRPLEAGVGRADLPPPLAQLAGQAPRSPARPAAGSGRVAFPTRPKLAPDESRKTEGNAEGRTGALDAGPVMAASAHEAAPFARSPEDHPTPVIPPPLEEIVPEPLRADPGGVLAAEMRTAATIETDQALQERREAAWHDAHDQSRAGGEAKSEASHHETSDQELRHQETNEQERVAQRGFDSIWDRDARPAAPPAEEPRAEAPEFIRRIKSPEPSQPRFAPRAEPHTDARPEPDSAPILKSGVVDGMGYTLYVDGSIEAELPQGTVRFASIAELREHLEKNG